MPALSRRAALVALALLAAMSFSSGGVFAQSAKDVSREMILNDPAAPVGGNPKGDLTIVAYVDYNCPYCKETAVTLDRVAREDGKIRIVYKDWPILRPSSIDGAMMALAAQYQGKYERAHHALMGIKGRDTTKDQMRQALKAAGIDMKRLDADLKKNRSAINTLIKRNMAQGDALGFPGTPSFLVGPYRASTLDYKNFKLIIADARAKQAEMK